MDIKFKKDFSYLLVAITYHIAKNIYIYIPEIVAACWWGNKTFFNLCVLVTYTRRAVEEVVCVHITLLEEMIWRNQENSENPQLSN